MPAWLEASGRNFAVQVCPASRRDLPLDFQLGLSQATGNMEGKKPGESGRVRV